MTARFPRRALPLFAAAFGCACGDAPSTGGKRVVLGCRVRPEATQFSNAYGFTVSLERVVVAIGPLRYFEGLPIAGASMLDRVIGLRIAHAHPGHYLAGGVLGEMLEPTSIELTEGETSLPSGPGVAGAAHSAQFSFQTPAAGPYAAELANRVVLVRGVARDGAGSRAFEASAVLEDVVDASGEALITGCELDGGPITADGVVTLTLRPSVWLDQVDFGALPVGQSPEPTVLAREESAHRAFARGLKKAAAYRFTYAAGANSRQ